jgi:hypothetical protein
MYKLEAVANGWIVRPSPDFSRDQVISASQMHVFNNFSDLSDWLEENMPLASKVDKLDGYR